MRRIVVSLGKHFVSNYAWFWRAVSAVPLLRRITNWAFTNLLAYATPPRPHPLAVWGAKAPDVENYVTWPGLVDRSYTGRHLEPAEKKDVDALPDLASDEFKALFLRQGEMIPCPKSSALFGFFAQWFTDSFLRTDPWDTRKNTSNHEIDLCQIYGLNAADTALLRSKMNCGELASQEIEGEEFPPYLFEDDGMKVAIPYRKLSYINETGDGYRDPNVVPEHLNTANRRAKLFVSGLERGNSTIFYSALNTVFLREHNRLSRALHGKYSEWTCDRVFETARNINIAMLLRIIIEDYINHLSPAHFRLFVDIGVAEREQWYRTNRICAEFNLLYRWHQLVPTQLQYGGASLPDTEFRFNNKFLVKEGIEEVLAAAASQRAGRITLRNTADFLVLADLAAVNKSRGWRVRSYNDYRDRFKLWRVGSFKELTGDDVLAAQLEKIYGDVNKVEFPVGLFAEARSSTTMLGDLMTAMVAVDAFSQALTNPLLSRNVYGAKYFPKLGRDYMEMTATLDDVVRRNTKLAPRKASFTIAKPPGGQGLKLLRTIFDTLDFVLLSGWHGFFSKRKQRYGSTVFRVHMFETMIALLDDRAVSAMFDSPDLVPDRPIDGFRFQIPPLPILGGVAPGMFETGAAHDLPKALYQNLLRKRVGTLAGEFARTFDEFAAKWEQQGSFGWRDELENLAATFASRWYFNQAADAKKVRDLFSNIFSQWAGPLTKYLPWSSYVRCQDLRRELVGYVKGSPAFAEIMELARAAGLADEDVVAKQMTYFLGNNSFLGLQSVFKSVIGELSAQPKLRDALRDEIVAAFGEAPGEIDLRKLAGLPQLDHALREILRLHPPVFFLLARATRDRVIESNSGVFAVDRGELLIGVIPFAHLDDAVHPDPERFDPDRFAVPAGKAEAEASRHLIWPRGLHDGPVTDQNRTCPGKDVAILIAKLFCVALLPRYRWELAKPPRWGRHFFTLNVAAPVGAMRVKSFARAAAKAG